jgi:branched-chain amino acid transport system ATP-binding protein
MFEARDVVGAYGVVEVVKRVSLTVRPGELVTLLGPNGAGKSTFLKMVVGLLPCRSGQILLNGEEIGGLSPPAILRRKVALVPEGRQIFGPLTVLENLQLGAYHRRKERAERGAIASDLARVYDLFPVLAERTTQAAGTLSGGEQQMVAIGRALMGRPDLLLLDEPSLGLAPKVVGTIMATLRSLKEGGLTILLVEQNAKLALEIADRGYIMRTGVIVLDDLAENLRKDPALMRIYLGMS